MKSTNKYKMKYIFWIIILFLCLYVLFLCLIFPIFYVFYEFSLISVNVAFFVPVICPIPLSIIYIIIFNISIGKDDKKHKKRNQINFTRIYPCLFLLDIFSLAIKKDIYMESNTLVDFLNIQWIVFGISIAIFGIWMSGIMTRKNEFLSEIDGTSIIKEDKKALEIQNERKHFVNVHFSIFCLICNLILLIITTTLFYIEYYGKINLVTQCLSIASCFTCTNSLISIFVDVLAPILHFKKEVKKVYEIDEEKIQKQNNKKEFDKILNQALAEAKNETLKNTNRKSKRN